MVRYITLRDGTKVAIPEEQPEEEEAGGLNRYEFTQEEPPRRVDASMVEQEPEEAGDDLSDLTQVSKEEVLGKPDANSGELDISDITSLDEEEEEDDLEDLFEYDGDEDEIKEEEYPGMPATQGEDVRKPTKRATRRLRPQKSQDTELGGIRY